MTSMCTEVSRMDRDKLESMTVVQLKDLLEEKNLSKSGKKSELIDRLLEKTLIIDEDDDFLILEEEEETEANSSPNNDSIQSKHVDETEVMEATIIEAVLVEDEDLNKSEVKPLKIRESVTQTTEPLIEIKIHAKKPRRAVVLTLILLVAIVAGGGYWWTWVQDQQSFTAEPARYGDSMTFTMTDGQISATGDEMVDLLRENTGSALEKACGDLQVAMSGTGTMSFRNAPSSEISNPNDRTFSGSVESIDGYGRIHLTAERSLSYDLNVDLSGRTWVDPDKCSNSLTWEMNSNSVEISSLSWEELTEQTTIRSISSLDFRTPDNDQTRVDTVSFGGTGVSAIDGIIPFLLQPAIPMDLYEEFGTTLIEPGVSGEVDGWNFVIKDFQRVNGQLVIPIDLEQPTINSCLGHAKMSLQLVEGNPWPIEQYVDILIDKDRKSNSCGTLESAALELAVPEGQLIITYKLTGTSFSAGDRTIDWGVLYSSRPGAGEDIPSSQTKWTNHISDESIIRQFTVEEAVDCLMNTSSANGVRSALNEDGYLWKVEHRQENGEIINLSWVDPQDDAGWTEVKGTSSESCEVIHDGTMEPSDSPGYNLNAIPSSGTLSLSTLETRMLEMDGSDEPGSVLKEGQGLKSEVKIGAILLATSSSDLIDLVTSQQNIDQGEVGFTASRSWTEGSTEHDYNVAMDAERGRMIGWIHMTVS
jgi:hypothetical protein